MLTGRAVLQYPVEARTPWYLAFGLAAAGIGNHLALTLAAVAAGAVVVAALLLLLAVAAPLGAGLLLWILWRSAATPRAAPASPRRRA